ncbi:MAG: hypothetical protein JST81_07890 [Bacteroidetes bacterium]|nr:hypothetical protein [Bacteroidota bacterium]
MKPYLPNIVGKTALLIFLCFTLVIPSYAQHLSFGKERVVVECGLNFGPTFFLGDLGGHRGKGTHFVKDLNLPLTKLMKGAFIAVYPNDWLGIRVAGQYTYVEGRDNIIDTKGEDELWRKQRNLDFRSDVWELYGAFEVYPTMLFNTDEDYDPIIRPYGFIGVGMFHFDPEGSLTDSRGNVTWHKLHPLKTEGQGMPEYPDKKPYSLTQMNIPMGFGARVKISPRVNTSLELLYRKTFTDYMDDVSTTYIDPNDFDRNLSQQDAAIARQIHDKTVGIITPGINRYEPGTQRGNSKNMDAYFSFVIKLGIQLGDVYDSRPDKVAKRQMRCPHFF